MENFDTFQPQLTNQLKNVQLITQSVEKSKMELARIKNQWEAAKTKCNEQKIELQNLYLREIELTKTINEQRQRQEILKNECEKIGIEIERIQYGRKIALLKQQNEIISRQYYESIMENFSPEVPDFLNINEYFSKLEAEREKEALKLKIVSLKNQIEELSTMVEENNEDEIMRHIQKHPSEKLRMLKKSLQKIDIIIHNRTEELKKLSAE